MKKKIIVATLLIFGLLFLYSYFFQQSYTRGPHPIYTYDSTNIRTLGHFIYTHENMADRFPMSLSDLFDPDTGVLAGREDDYIQNFVAHHNYSKVGEPESVDEWTDYVYVPGHTFDSPSSLVLLFLPAGHHYDEKFYKTIVFTVGGAVEQLGPEEFATRMNQTFGFLHKKGIVEPGEGDNSE